MEAVPKHPARIADVAARAGVGIATVSRVVNDRGNVAAPTRERVLEAIRALEYRPSSVDPEPLAEADTRDRRRAAVPDGSLADRACAAASSTALASSPYDLALYDVESADRQQRAFRLLADAHRTDGLLVVSLIPPDEEVRRLRAESIPCVLIDARHDGLPSVVIDDVAGGELATRHLLELGHRRIAFIGGKQADPFRFQSSRDRTARLPACPRIGRRPDPSRVRPGGNAEPSRRAEHRGRAASAP